MSREAYYLVCDEAQVSLTSNKFNLLGIYNADIAVPQAGLTAGQLVFHFVVHCDLTERPNLLTLEVTLPGSAPKTLPVPIVPPPHVSDDRTRWVAQVPFVLHQPVLNPGRVEGRVLFDGGHAVSIRGPWIVLSVPPPQLSGTNAS